MHVPTTPPGRTTRASSAAACSCRGANMWPKVDSTRSNDASSNGSDSASASTHSTSTPAASARARAASNSSGVRSEPVTFAPRWAAGIDTVPPLPVPTSSTSMPGSMPTRSSSAGPTAAMVSETVSQSPPAHVVRARCLNSVTASDMGTSWMTVWPLPGASLSESPCIREECLWAQGPRAAIVVCATTFEPSARRHHMSTTATATPVGTWNIDPSHSNVNFQVKHLGIATVRGAFTEFEGTLELGDDLSTSKAYGTVEVASRGHQRGRPRRAPALRRTSSTPRSTRS